MSVLQFFTLQGDGDKGMALVHKDLHFFNDARHFADRFDNCGPEDKAWYYKALRATSREAVDAAVKKMTAKAKRIIKKYDLGEIFPAYAPLFVRSNHTSNISESFMYRLDRSNPDNIGAVRRSRDIFNMIVSALRMCEAMFAIRVKAYEDQKRKTPPDLLTKFARDKIR